MDWIVQSGTFVFVTLEIVSLICLLLFGLTRYWFDHHRLSIGFILLFIVITALEAVLAWILYSQTGEISTLQIIITIFVLYAVTFGIQDFLKLDRWMKQNIGQWRNIELLTEDDYRKMEKQKDPYYQARQYRYYSIAHATLFLAFQITAFYFGTNSFDHALMYLSDWSWFNEDSYESTPYPNNTIHQISMVWGIVFVIDTIYSWSYTFFPKKESA